MTYVVTTQTLASLYAFFVESHTCTVPHNWLFQDITRLLFVDFSKLMVLLTVLWSGKNITFYFLNKSVKNEPILIIFVTQNPEI